VPYVVLASLWILVSDRLAEQFFPDPATLAVVSTLKGWFFVALTATLLSLLLRRLLKNIDNRQAAEREAWKTADNALRALENERAQLRTLLDTLPDLIWLKDPDGIYLSCNKRFEEFFGASEAQICGKTDFDFVDRELAEFFLPSGPWGGVAGMLLAPTDSRALAAEVRSATAKGVSTSAGRRAEVGSSITIRRAWRERARAMSRLSSGSDS